MTRIKSKGLPTGRSGFRALLVAACALSPVFGHAATVTFAPKASAGLSPGDTFSVDVILQDFPSTIGGGFNLAFDTSVIASVSFTCNSSVWNFDCGNRNSSTGTLTDAYVSVFNAASGNLLVGTLAIKLAAPGLSTLTLTESPLNPWSSPDAAFLPTGRINPTFVNGALDFSGGNALVSAVPIPALGYMLAPAMGVLFGMGWRNRARRQTGV